MRRAGSWLLAALSIALIVFGVVQIVGGLSTPEPRTAPTSPPAPDPSPTRPPLSPGGVELPTVGPRPIVQVTAISCEEVVGNVAHNGALVRDYLVSGIYYPPDGLARPLPQDMPVEGTEFRLRFPTRPPPGRLEVRVTADKPGLGASLPARVHVEC